MSKQNFWVGTTPIYNKNPGIFCKQKRILIQASPLGPFCRGCILGVCTESQGRLYVCLRLAAMLYLRAPNFFHFSVLIRMGHRRLVGWEPCAGWGVCVVCVLLLQHVEFNTGNTQTHTRTDVRNIRSSCDNTAQLPFAASLLPYQRISAIQEEVSCFRMDNASWVLVILVLVEFLV